MSGHLSHPRYGSIEHRTGGVRPSQGYQPRPVSANSTPETKMVKAISDGLTNRHVNTRAVAAMLTMLPTSLQTELADIVWHLIDMWGSRVIPPGNAMEPHAARAQRISRIS